MTAGSTSSATVRRSTLGGSTRWRSAKRWLKWTLLVVALALVAGWLWAGYMPFSFFWLHPERVQPENRLAFLPPADPGQEWHLVFSDEFDGNALDETKWKIEGDYARKGGWWRREAVALNGHGQLAIRTYRDGDRYVDGCITAPATNFAQPFGFYTVRARLHKQPGHWPAFWIMAGEVGRLSGREGTEIDIFEKPTLGNRVQQTLHWGGYAKDHHGAERHVRYRGVMEGWHTYGLRWTPNEYVFYIDGVQTWRNSYGGVCQRPGELIISDEIGSWGGDITQADLPDAFEVDYVRVYNLRPKERAPFRIVAYATEGIAEDRIPYGELTHINYAFLIPNADGTFRPIGNADKLKRIVQAARAHGVRVSISVGGWGWHPQFEEMAAKPETRAAFVTNLRHFVEDFGLDGVDLDWEYPKPGRSANNFLALTRALRATLPEKTLTAAVIDRQDAGRSGIPVAAFPQLDFVNVMTYDGPDHGSMEQFTAGLEYWRGRGMPDTSIVMGVPFYSRVKGLPNEGAGYAALVAADPTAAQADSFVRSGLTHRYNGILTIREKTRIALRSAGGIMFWALNDDAPGALSLVHAIYQTAHPK